MVIMCNFNSLKCVVMVVISAMAIIGHATEPDLVKVRQTIIMESREVKSALNELYNNVYGNRPIVAYQHHVDTLMNIEKYLYETHELQKVVQHDPAFIEKAEQFPHLYNEKDRLTLFLKKINDDRKCIQDNKYEHVMLFFVSLGMQVLIGMGITKFFPITPDNPIISYIKNGGFLHLLSVPLLYNNGHALFNKSRKMDKVDALLWFTADKIRTHLATLPAN